LAARGYFRRPVEEVFLILLNEYCDMERWVSASSHSPNYAPRLFARRPAKDRDEYLKVDFERAMDKLFADRKIKNAHYGRPGDERKKIMRHTDEKQESDENDAT
jgi:hypothetical protein